MLEREREREREVGEGADNWAEYSQYSFQANIKGWSTVYCIGTYDCGFDKARDSAQCYSLYSFTPRWRPV